MCRLIAERFAFIFKESACKLSATSTINHLLYEVILGIDFFVYTRTRIVEARKAVSRQKQ